jgi:hypothetical protein
MVTIVPGDFLELSLDLLEYFYLQRCCMISGYLDVAWFVSGGTSTIGGLEVVKGD